MYKLKECDTSYGYWRVSMMFLKRNIKQIYKLMLSFIREKLVYHEDFHVAD